MAVYRWILVLAALGMLADLGGRALGRRARDCDPSYPTVCVPSPPPDLDCADVKASSFRVVGVDPHHFDGDGDGVGCEPWSPRD
jgi:hypothetical protein